MPVVAHDGPVVASFVASVGADASVDVDHSCLAVGGFLWAVYPPNPRPQSRRDRWELRCFVGEIGREFDKSRPVSVFVYYLPLQPSADVQLVFAY